MKVPSRTSSKKEERMTMLGSIMSAWEFETMKAAAEKDDDEVGEAEEALAAIQENTSVSEPSLFFASY